ncbi:MAG: hypothetical protein AB7P04_04710 [Bacteriovoracia bacterium]
MKKTILCLVLCASTSAFAATRAPEPSEESKPIVEGFSEFQGSFVTMNVGLNLLSRAKDTNSDWTQSFLGGATYSYYFTQNVGILTGAQFTRRALSVNGLSSGAGYLDIPLAFTFSPGKSMFGGASRSHTHIGAYYALPLSDFSGDLTINFGSQSKSFFGIYVGSDTFFPVSPHFALGFGLWVKFGLGSAFQGADAAFGDIGLGLSAVAF